MRFACVTRDSPNKKFQAPVLAKNSLQLNLPGIDQEVSTWVPRQSQCDPATAFREPVFRCCLPNAQSFPRCFPAVPSVKQISQSFLVLSVPETVSAHLERNLGQTRVKPWLDKSDCERGVRLLLEGVRQEGVDTLAAFVGEERLNFCPDLTEVPQRFWRCCHSHWTHY